MIYCRKCGNQMPDDSVFCSKCGCNQNESVGSSNTPAKESLHPNDESTLYFGYSSKAITIFFLSIAVIFIISLIATISINGKIAELERLYDRNWAYKYKEAINEVTSLRNFNIFFDILLSAALIWRCLLIRKNHLRVYSDHISGTSCLPIGVTTVDINNLSYDRIHSVSYKNDRTLIVEADKKYVFIIDNADIARNEIYWRIHKKPD